MIHGLTRDIKLYHNKGALDLHRALTVVNEREYHELGIGGGTRSEFHFSENAYLLDRRAKYNITRYTPTNPPPLQRKIGFKGGP